MTDMTDEDGAIEALTTLGLSAYAAETFVGLQKLGVGSASEVATVTDVPRSQVYGATDELEEFGLVDVHEGSPKRYRPVAVSEARELLFSRLHSTGEGAFEYIESVRGQRTTPEESQEAIWTTEGKENITTRVTSLVRGADRQMVFATGEPTLIEGAVLDAIVAASEETQVIVASADDRVRAIAEDAGLETTTADRQAAGDVHIGRVLTVDDDTMLLSVLPATEVTGVDTEAAFWSDGTGFASVLTLLIRGQFV
jgi:Predicted transcriptional regulators